MHELPQHRASLSRRPPGPRQIVAAAHGFAGVLHRNPRLGPEIEVATQLPAADLPSMNEQGFLFELDSSWAGSFDTCQPKRRSTSMTLPTYDAEASSELAATSVSRERCRTRATARTWSTAMVRSSSPPISHNTFRAPRCRKANFRLMTRPLPIAREWLRQIGHLPADAGEG